MSDWSKGCRCDEAGAMAAECRQCEDGLIESIVAGSASKTEYSYCSCAAGRAAQATHDDALEAKGEERGR